MTIVQYLKHVWHWVRGFPSPFDTTHLYMETEEGNEARCLMCGDVFISAKESVGIKVSMGEITEDEPSP